MSIIAIGLAGIAGLVGGVALTLFDQRRRRRPLHPEALAIRELIWEMYDGRSGRGSPKRTQAVVAELLRRVA